MGKGRFSLGGGGFPLYQNNCSPMHTAPNIQFGMDIKVT